MAINVGRGPGNHRPTAPARRRARTRRRRAGTPGDRGPSSPCHVGEKLTKVRTIPIALSVPGTGAPPAGWRYLTQPRPSCNVRHTVETTVVRTARRENGKGHLILHGKIRLFLAE
jgi:hypothetical protein